MEPIVTTAAQMAALRTIAGGAGLVAGPRAATTASGPDWSDTDRIGLCAESYVTYLEPGGIHLAVTLEARNFGFALPSGSRILGVEVSFRRKRSGVGAMADVLLQLRLDGGYIGADRLIEGNWPAVTETLASGGAADLWGTINLSAAQVNNATFGFIIQLNAIDAGVTAHVNCFKVKVWYRPPAG